MGSDVVESQVVRCECGYAVSAADEAVLVDAIRAHARNAHEISFSMEDALLVVFRSQLDVAQTLTGPWERPRGTSR
ncbi:MAG TPA: DUF1059 domain-containing protein [Gaiellaceae bacterium]|nr:DUF1059 domain-containing protein [Gaiellaceae bacterium]